MKSFKIYTKGYSTRMAIKWSSAFSTIIGLIIVGISIFNYSRFSGQGEIVEAAQGLFLRDIWFGGCLAGLGLIILLAAIFAGGSNNQSNDVK